MDIMLPILMPACVARRKPQPRPRKQEPDEPVGAAFEKFGHRAASALSDALGGALDGALAAWQVPHKRNPLGARFSDVDELKLALAEARLELPALRLLLGVDCSVVNRRAGRTSFGGKSLHSGLADGMIGPDPNPYQMAFFMLGKALECALGTSPPVSCFCFGGGEIGEPTLCDSMEGALHYYNQLAPSALSGDDAADAAAGFGRAVLLGATLADAAAADGALMTLLMLITPGQQISATAAQALQSASAHPLSVLAVGVGDGPFHELGRLACATPQNMNAVVLHGAISEKFPDRALALEALRVLPDQLEARESQRRTAAARAARPS